MPPYNLAPPGMQAVDWGTAPGLAGGRCTPYPGPMHAWPLIAALVTSAAPPFLLLAFLGSRAPRPHLGAGSVAVAFGAGMTAGMVAFFLFQALEWLPVYAGLVTGVSPEYGPNAVFLLGIVGPVEEVLKIAAVSLTAVRIGGVRRATDAMIHASAAALGFAAVENWYAMWATGGPDLGRAFVVPFLHLLFTSLSGWGLARTVVTGRRWPLFLGALLAASYHGLFDILEFQGGAWHFATLPVVALLWYFLSETMTQVSRRKGRKPGAGEDPTGEPRTPSGTSPGTSTSAACPSGGRS